VWFSEGNQRERMSGAQSLLMMMPVCGSRMIGKTIEEALEEAA
jgi:hypothetical protein